MGSSLHVRRYLSIGIEVNPGNPVGSYIESAPQLTLSTTDAATDSVLDPTGVILMEGPLQLSSSHPLRAGGTAFPASPAENDLYYRTDLDLLFFWNGIYWLTVNEYSLTAPYPRTLMPASATGVVADGILERDYETASGRPWSNTRGALN